MPPAGKTDVRDDETGDPVLTRIAPMWLWIACAVAAIVVAVLLYRWVEPAPPSSVRLAAGPSGGGYESAAKLYAEVFKDNGMELEIVETAGSVENYQKLLAGEVDFAIVQGGTLPEEGKPRELLSSVAAIYLEPLFVFYDTDFGELDDLGQLRGKSLSVSKEGSGTRMLASMLLEDTGHELFDAGQAMSNGEQWRLGEGTTLLSDGTTIEVDATFIVSTPRREIVRELLADEGVTLLSLRRANAISRSRSFLETVTLFEGVVDLKENLPARDIELVAPAAVLVTHNETHSAAVLLAAMAAEEAHRDGDYLSPPGTFPTDRYTELPMNSTAAHYLDSGPSFLRRTLPFWAASLVERMIIVIVPLLTLLIPLARLAPPVYRWQIRSRIYKWYKRLRDIDNDFADGTDEAELVQLRERLAELEHEVRCVKVPLSYHDELYDLRMHIELLQQKVGK